MNETLAFLREVRAAHHQGQGEDLAITLDMSHAHLILTSPFAEPQRFELTDDSSHGSSSQSTKCSERSKC